jgi:membrane-associated phospholipid phosphatase
VVPDDPLTANPAPAKEVATMAPAAARRETAVGVALVGVSIVSAAIIHLYPGINQLDRRGFSLIVKSPGSTVLLRIADLGSPVSLVIGTVVAAVVAATYDRWRAAACVAGPLATAVLVEYVLKPAVGRHYEGVLSYPSGNVADVAAVAAALSVAAPRWIRPVVIVAGAVAVGLITVAVIGLRWHYPSDALAGAVLGVALVLLADGAVHLARPSGSGPSVTTGPPAEFW